ncbi:MAG: response regulator [Myxococcota bacterium]
MRSVLIVDDDRPFAEAVHEELERDGYAVSVVHDAAGLQARLAGDPAHVVLLDVRLTGPGGGDDGLELVPNILLAWPFARVVVVSGFVSAQAIRRAYEQGAVDILRKDEVLVEMLRHKIRRAAGDAERDLAADPGHRERTLREAWAECRRETDRHRKGEALERVVGLVLASIPGLSGWQRMRNGTEEFDLVVSNRSADPFLTQQGSVWLVECKNWSTASGVPEVRPLVEKMQNRRGRCRLGFAVSMNGFARTVEEDLLRTSRTDALVVLVTGDDLDRWIAVDDRTAWLIDRITAAASR